MTPYGISKDCRVWAAGVGGGASGLGVTSQVLSVLGLSI